MPKITPTLDAGSIRLRTLKVEDTQDMHAIYSDTATMEYWGSTATTSIDATRRLVERDIKAVDDGLAIFWAIELKETGKVIGKCTLWHFNESNHRAEVGYVLNREYWRGGLMTSALKAMIMYAFTELGLHRLEADTDPDNTASLALLEKLGFQREGYFRERWFVDGIRLDSVMLGLLEQDWSALKG